MKLFAAVCASRENPKKVAVSVSVGASCRHFEHLGPSEIRVEMTARRETRRDHSNPVDLPERTLTFLVYSFYPMRLHGNLLRSWIEGSRRATW